MAHLLCLYVDNEKVYRQKCGSFLPALNRQLDRTLPLLYGCDYGADSGWIKCELDVTYARQ